MLPHEYALYLAEAYALYPTHPLISDMVSERYRRDEDDYASDDASNSASDSSSECDEEDDPLLENDPFAIIFGNFAQHFDPIPAPPIVSIKPEIDGSNVTIGTIKCSFGSFVPVSQLVVDPEMEEVKEEEGTLQIDCDFCTTAKIDVSEINIVSDIDEKSKEIVTEVAPLSPEPVPDPPAIDGDVDFDIRNFTSFVRNPDLVSLCLVAFINCGSAGTDTVVETSVRWFSTNEPRKGVDVLVEALDSRFVITVSTVEHCSSFFDLARVSIAVFDPGGNRHRSPLTMAHLASTHQGSKLVSFIFLLLAQLHQSCVFRRRACSRRKRNSIRTHGLAYTISLLKPIRFNSLG